MSESSGSAVSQQQVMIGELHAGMARQHIEIAALRNEVKDTRARLAEAEKERDELRAEVAYLKSLHDVLRDTETQSNVKLARKNEVLRARADALETLVEKAKALVNALTPEQRQCETLSPECPDLIDAINAWEARRSAPGTGGARE